MKNIKRLPRSVHSSLHSGVFLFDMNRVVEELIFNSVDAGATKVYVYLRVEACYVKVEDNGSGITREGLVLLGEKHATSKLHHVVGMDVNVESLGHRGETLGSLSDVSLLEVVTKAHGKPNGYHKVMKGWKCLFLEIDDNKQEVGTTVIVRDLFYNQPVRRRFMQFSPKKVLHYVKKCVLRIAFVHPHVSFKVIDMENETELLYTLPSASPLPIVCNAFGNEVSSSLHEINISDKVFKLSGYLSRPVNTFSTKAFQYLYINSRFVCKGLVHNLINSLSADHQCSVKLWRGEPEVQSGKRHKIQMHAAYLLNISCPLSTYDLAFESSKTIVQFKDWAPLLSFIENAVRNFWKQFSSYTSQGESNNAKNDEAVKKVKKKDTSQGSKITKEKCDLRSCCSPMTLSPPFNSVKMPSDFDDYYIQRSPLAGLQNSNKEVKSCQCKTACGHLVDYSSFSMQDVFRSTNDKIVLQETCSYPSKLENSFLSEDLLWSNGNFLDTNKNQIHSKWENGSIDLDKISRKGFTDKILFDTFDNEYGAEEVPFSEMPSKLRAKTSPLTLFSGHIGYGVSFDNLSGKLPCTSDSDDFAAAYDYGDSCFSLDTFHQDEVAAYQPAFMIRKCRTRAESDFLSSDFTEPHYHDKIHSSEEKKIQMKADNNFFDSESFVSPDSSNRSMLLKAGHSLNKCASERSGTTKRNLHSNHHGDGDSEEFPKFAQGIDCDVFLPRFYCGISKRKDKFHFSPEKIMYCNSSKKAEPARLHNELEGFDTVSSFIGDTFHLESYQIPSSITSHQHHTYRKRHVRSCSAPPFCRRKNKISTTCDYSTTLSDKEVNAQIGTVTNSLKETGYPYDGLSQPCGVSQPYVEHIPPEPSLSCSRKYEDEKSFCEETNKMQRTGKCEKVQFPRLSNVDQVKDILTNKVNNPETDRAKWRNDDSELTDGDVSLKFSDDDDDILDISSGLLHLASSPLIPESISRGSLEDATVLQQLDRKYIPIVAGGTLAVVDQHAADERIRLENLRQKVMSGEGSSITYMDSEQEMVLPEIGFQLLQMYSEQIKKWGWICNIHMQSSESFSRNLNILKRRPFSVTLIAVPCILGINLTDKDLIEFLEQLAETGGSSAIPPSVNRVLNLKACRGAIMFGDSLLPSECSLIIEELKATSLCFQCAHGRPTTVPLVDMVKLHKQLAKLQQPRGQSKLWHGLCQNRPSIEQARQRLRSAKRFQSDH